MVSITCSNSADHLKSVTDDFRVLLYGSANQSPDRYCIGNTCKNQITHLNLLPSQRAFDFLSIALSVVAADLFIAREEYGSDGFARPIDLTVAIGNPQPWNEVKDSLEKTLCFLTGDRWALAFIDGGERAPSKLDQKNIRKFNKIHKADSVCLFSGGMDSFMGAFHLMGDSTPVLVSRAPTGDQKYQNKVASFIPDLSRFAVNDSPQFPPNVLHEVSTRARSLLFIAIAGIVCSALSNIKKGNIPLVIPENGFIALNPPLTKRRLGANSTRTVHPFYISSLQNIFQRVDLPISIENPFSLFTKGEMLENMLGVDAVKNNITETVSCGHWKRSHKQCGRCWPCVIRRSSMFKAGIDDTTEYQDGDLTKVLANSKKNTDLRAVLYALRQYDKNGLRCQPIRSIRNISSDISTSSDYKDVVCRGFEELREFLFEQQVWQ